MWRTSKERAIGVKELHSFSNHLDFLNNILARENQVYFALLQDSKKVVGLMATDNEYINQLYIDVEYQGMGVGSRLLALAKAKSGGNLQLFTFEVNRRAQVFYEKHGFRVIGHRNVSEEGLPDIHYEWRRQI